ncbi:o-glycosyl hydrolase family 16 [Clostridium sp. CAG:288]|jgi:O-glycosyl hydrolase, family 16|nr:o-glycosyl hydrolase family 16 [Clostridium sp. CAG:288]
MKLKNAKFIPLITTLLSVVSCSSGAKPQVLAVGGNIELLDGIKLDYKNAFFDDFTNGVSKDNWYIGKQAWGGSNGGVIPENINYTDDGVLVITGNGSYYDAGDVKGVGDVKDGRYTGGALISKFLTQSGRYEIKMKVLPRQGACTAFWTFAYNLDTLENHEIDIELPGGNRSGTVTFENVLNTNYITEQMNISFDTNLTKTISDVSNEVYLNDGEWHVYGFDWYTNPEQIVYYVDGKITAISNAFVPSMQSRLWVGAWFPIASAFVGSPEFETDNMYVDYVKYIPFEDQPYKEFTPITNGVALDNEYPTQPISTPTINKVANSTFEKSNLNGSKVGGWTATKRITEEKDLSEVIQVVDNEGYDDSRALKVSDGGIAYQMIDSVYHNFKHDFSVYAKGKGKITIRYYSITENVYMNPQTIEVDSDELKEYRLTDLVAPATTQRIRINIETTTGNSITVDNVSLIQK